LIPAKYSYLWADETVKSLEEKYARAASILYQSMKITHRNMAAFLATNDKAFAILRQRIHDIDAALAKHGDNLTIVQWRRFLEGQFLGTACERFRRRLDEVQNLDMFEEQESRGGG
jgi:hypothetical protein